MAETMGNEPKISIKAIVDKEINKVLYAEADYAFVDILFSFMTLPMGAIVRFLGEDADKKFEALGSLNNLYHSLVDLPECYFLSEECKHMLLNPRSPSYHHCRNLKLKIDDTEPTKYFVCKNLYLTASNKFSTCNTSKCSICGKLMDREISFRDNTESANNDNASRAVFVSDIATFIVTDDLCVMPRTPGRCIQLLTDLGVTDTSRLEERTVEICRRQILHLLRLSLLFNSPLTYVVLLKTPPSRGLGVFEQHKSDDQFASIKKEDSTSSMMVLQVSLQKSTEKLLFAEAEEDFVDFVFGFLAISLGTVVGKLMNGTSSLVCMDNIYRSISDMSTGMCFKSHNMKNILLKPHFGQPYSSKNQIFSINGSVFPNYQIAREVDNCAVNWYDKHILTYGEGKPCDRFIFDDPRIGGEFFKRSKMFMVTDDLLISSSSSISTIDMLNKWKVPLNDIEMHKVSIGLEEGLKMLKASLTSKSILTKGLEKQLKNLNQNY